MKKTAPRARDPARCHTYVAAKAFHPEEPAAARLWRGRVKSSAFTGRVAATPRQKRTISEKGNFLDGVGLCGQGELPLSTHEMERWAGCGTIDQLKQRRKWSGVSARTWGVGQEKNPSRVPRMFGHDATWCRQLHCLHHVLRLTSESSTYEKAHVRLVCTV